ncbi:E3 ubiquitin-protein ligase [Dirofilaria immitis]
MVSIENYGILHRSSSSLSNINDNGGPSLCQICFKPFKQKICIPKLLPCGHSFCHDCITALKFHSIYICKCPICRYSFPLQYDTKFPVNYSLLDRNKNTIEEIFVLKVFDGAKWMTKKEMGKKTVFYRFHRQAIDSMF